MPYSRTSCAMPAAAEVGEAAPRLLQHAWVTAAVAAAGLTLLGLPAGSWRMPTLLILGMALGAVLLLTSFGFTSAYRAFLADRDSAGVRAQILMLALATVLFTPVLAAGEVFGEPVTGAFAPAGVQVVAGAFLFGIGMQLAGGCASGTLFAAGGGSARTLVVLAFFVAGSFWSSLHMSWWERLPSRGEVVLGDLLGWKEALMVQLGFLAATWFLVGRVAPDRAEGSTRQAGIVALRRPEICGAVLLALLAFLVLLVAGHPWSITWAFTLLGAKALRLGWLPDESAFWNGDFQRRALEGDLLGDVTTVMDIGIVLGAAVAAGAAGRFRPSASLTGGSLAAAVVGGLMMGYGARIAYGCNIGAFFSGVASTSLHGWIWIVAAMGGNAIGIRLRPHFGLRN